MNVWLTRYAVLVHPVDGPAHFAGAPSEDYVDVLEQVKSLDVDGSIEIVKLDSLGFA